MSTLVFGTSHVFAIQSAWHEMPESERKVDLNFFRMPNFYLRHMQFESPTRIGIPKTKELESLREEVQKTFGAASLDVSNFKNVIHVGGQWQVGRIAEISSEFDIEGVREVGNSQLMSKPFFEKYCHHYSKAFFPATEWLALPGTRHYVVPKPNKNEKILAREKANGPIHKCADSGVPLRPVLDYFFDTVEEELAKLNCGFIRPPVDTIADTGLTKSEYSVGTVEVTDRKTGEKRVHEDINHCNTAFGKLMLHEIFARLIGDGRATENASTLELKEA